MYEYFSGYGLGASPAKTTPVSLPRSICGPNYQSYGSTSKKDDMRCLMYGCAQKPNNQQRNPLKRGQVMHFCCPNGSYPLTHPVGGMSGLGALGWSDAWYPGASVVPGVDISATASVQRNRSCGSSGRRMVCATPDEQAYLVREGCAGTQYSGSNICTTSDKNIGSLWCCASDRPRLTPEATAAPIQQLNASSGQITQLQTWINQQAGCSAGRVDGVWGPNTNTGLTCAAGRVGWSEIVSRFPFVQSLVATAQGYTKPTGQTTGGGGDGGGGGGGGGGGSQQQQETPPPEEASIFDQIFGVMPWWGWLGIAGGVGLLAVIGVAISKSGGEDEEPERPKFSGRTTELDTLRD